MAPTISGPAPNPDQVDRKERASAAAVERMRTPTRFLHQRECRREIGAADQDRCRHDPKYGRPVVPTGRRPKLNGTANKTPAVTTKAPAMFRLANTSAR